MCTRYLSIIFKNKKIWWMMLKIVKWLDDNNKDR